MGLEAMFFGRHDGPEDNLRLQRREEEWIQFPSYEALGSDAKILMHKLKNSYVDPDDFSFDIMDNDPIFQNDKSMDTFNAKERAEVFIPWLEDYSSCYATDQLFILFGMDFHYQNAFQNFENMDKMIDYMNENYSDKYIFKYGTPGNYVDAINAIEDREWPTKYDDLFPYGDAGDSFWTGYFSSRPNAKSYVRHGSR